MKPDGFETAEVGIILCPDCPHAVSRHGPDGCMYRKPNDARAAGLWTAHCNCPRWVAAFGPGAILKAVQLEA